MANKTSNKTKYTSAGLHRNVSKHTLNGMKKMLPSWTVFMNKFEAYLNGKNPWITIQNPNKNETNKRFIKVKAVDMYGSLKNRKLYIMKGDTQ